MITSPANVISPPLAICITIFSNISYLKSVDRIRLLKYNQFNGYSANKELHALTENKSALAANKILDQLKQCGITHIIWLPDSESRFMYDSLLSRPEFTLVPVCREGEAIPIATGLMLGGKKVVVLHQNTGFFESGDSIRGLALDLHLPLLLLIGYRGWQREHPLTDSAAIFTEPILDAWKIRHYLIENDEDTIKITTGYKEAQKIKGPVVILIGTEYK